MTLGPLSPLRLCALICSVSILASSSVAASARSDSRPDSRPQTKKSVSRRAPIFVFYDDEFWWNLHHFLYVLGRAENKTRDSLRDAVKGAPAEQQQGFAKLTANEQSDWKEIVSQYAAGPGKKSVFDDPLPAASAVLARASNAKKISDATIDPSLTKLLERAAPIYRKAWWPRHRAANKAWRSEIQKLLKQHGTRVLNFISNAYQLEWAAAGHPVHIAAYCNWAGAYSITGGLLCVSSLSESNHGPTGLESVFHEGMHQWDNLVDAALRKQAPGADQRMLDQLSHALVFFTAGDAVRRVIPEHTPHADKDGVWQRGMLREKDALSEIWKPYLDGRGTRDEAFAQLIKRLGGGQ
jgi:hypothetical protein